MTQEELRQYLRYEPETGDFFWVKKSSSNTKLGAKAGSLNELGYIQIQLKGKLYAGHTLAWLYVHGEKARVDHRDLNRANNRIDNLRKATQSQNIANSPLSSRNTTGYKGVHFNKRNKKFQAYIKVDYVRIHLGYYDSALSAHEAYLAAANKHFGEFARSA